jgi:hypothetical protein
VLGAVVVHLHREGAARFHRDAVDVEARVWTTTSQRPQGR